MPSGRVLPSSRARQAAEFFLAREKSRTENLVQRVIALLRRSTRDQAGKAAFAAAIALVVCGLVCAGIFADHIIGVSTG